jgi:hypothetical protein
MNSSRQHDAAGDREHMDDVPRHDAAEGPDAAVGAHEHEHGNHSGGHGHHPPHDAGHVEGEHHTA